ncbi:MAG: tetratricopeptide repeat protein, partial [Planctomycetota bacterium]
ASLAKDVLEKLTEGRHRIQVLPSAVRLYVLAEEVEKAREHLDEYLETISTRQNQEESQFRLAYLNAIVAKAEGDLYGVIDALQPIVANQVFPPELLALLAEAFSRTDQTRRAVDALKRYIRIRPQEHRMAQQLTKEYLKLRDWSKALQAAQLAESLDPTDIALKLLRLEASINVVSHQTVPDEVEQQMALAAKREQLAEKALELSRLREDYPKRVDIPILQAIIANQLGRHEEAEHILKQAIEDCDEKLRAEMQLVRHYYRMERMTEAISCCNAACARHPEVSEPWLSLSGLHSADGDYDLALDCLRQGCDSVVDRWEKRRLSIQLALLELMHGDKDSGIKLLTEIADQDEGEVHARVLLLNIDKVQDDPKRAAELIGQLRDVEGETGLKWRFYQASAWLSSDQWRSKRRNIVSHLEYCIPADPQWSAPALLLVDLYERLKDFRRVEDTCRQALARNPSATEIADRLLIFLERQGRFADAEKVFRDGGVDAAVASGWTVRSALREGNFVQAINELMARISNDKQDSASRILLARLTYAQSKDRRQAFAYLKEAENINPGSHAIAAVRASLYRAEGKTEEARNILNDYVKGRADFNAHWMRAVYLSEEGDLEGAEKDYDKLTTFDEPEQSAVGYALLSAFYVRTGRLDVAVSALEKGLRAHPEHLALKRAHMKTLFLRAGEHDREDALKILGELAEQLPDDPELKIIAARQKLQDGTSGSAEAARELLEEAVREEPGAVDAHLMLIGLAFEAGEFEQARNYAIRALSSNPKNVPLLAARARAELELENNQMAAEIARLALQEDLTNDEARDLLLAAASVSGETSLLQEYRKLIESQLGRSPAQQEQLLISRAAVMTALKSPQTAIPELEAYCRTEQGSASITAIITLADLYRMSGDMDQTKLWIDKAEQIDPDGQTAIHARFLWLLSQNRFEKLEGISGAYIEAKEQNPTAVLKAASELAELESMTLRKEGLKLFEHAVTLAPRSKRTRLGLARTLYRTGNTDRAVKAYEELLEQYPQDIEILNDLAWVYQEHYQRYADALDLADKGLRIGPDDEYLLDTRGTILSKMPGRLDDARKDFEKLAEVSSPGTPRKAKALLQLGLICAKLDDLVQARQHLSDALEIDKKMNVFTAEERSEITKIIQM